MEKTDMLLLVTSNARGPEIAKALRKACGQGVELAQSFRGGMARVRTQDYSLIIIDQAMQEPDPLAIDLLLNQAVTAVPAVPVYLNFSLSKTDRIVREVQRALRRNEVERLIAMRNATTALRNQLTGAVTGILLSSELALSVPKLPADAEAKLRSVHELAEVIRKRLEEPKTDG